MGGEKARHARALRPTIDATPIGGFRLLWPLVLLTPPSRPTMCVGFWTLDHPNWSLYVPPPLHCRAFLTDESFAHSVLCANRDEVLDRPTLPARWHNFARHTFSSSTSQRPSTTEGSTSTLSSRSGEGGYVLSGIDVQAGGTWMGVNRDGRIAML